MHMATKLKRWTLEEVHSLPDDGNKYELIRGQLFVTPPPAPEHEAVAARLTHKLVPYVDAQRLGMVYHPRAVIQFEGSEVEPDMMVRQMLKKRIKWDRQPVPILVVEILSPYTRRRDQTDKRSLYMDAGVDEYWIVDPEQRTIRSIRRDGADIVNVDTLAWNPAGATQPLLISVSEILGDLDA
jgi:Uma2 family endonuclease